MPSVKKPKPKIVKHPWKRWLAKKQLVLVRGIHYHGQPHTMAQQVRNKARKWKIKVGHITINGDVVTANFLHSKK